MLKNAQIVIGAAWGDEGKGHITDILCSKDSSKKINVRFNGGAQASHTVVTPDGKRHAFRHFGSGTFAGVPTYLSEDFLVNIFTFETELMSLKEEFGISPMLYVNPNSRVTTIWDITINQMIENMREERHGSCGLGINETVHRSKYPEYRITALDLVNLEKLKEKLELIQNEYVPMRLKNKYGLTIEELPEEYKKQFTDSKRIEMTLFNAEFFTKNVSIREGSLLNKYDTAVFEGAQGLLLDQGYQKFWPNVTTSNTGIKNVMTILNNLNFEGQVEIYYTSRCYATRHGRGIFPTETDGKPYSKIVDLTNVPNEFQESMRFGLLDVDLLIEAITGDLENLKFSAKVFMVFTCFDQLDDWVSYSYQREKITISKTHFIEEMLTIFSKKIESLSNMYVATSEKRSELK